MKAVIKVTILLIIVFLAFTVSTVNADGSTQTLLDSLIMLP